jgi:type I restriction enzyme, S subunit
MIADLKPYPEYRESEGKWLGKVPSHWAVRRFKYILREKDSRSAGGKEQLLRVSQFTGVTQRLSANGLDEPDTRAASLVGYKCVNPDDLVINIMLAWNGSLGVSRYDGIASPAYCVYRFGNVAKPWYYHHLLRSTAYKSRIKALSTGVVESRLRLYTDDLFRLEALLPPLDEQAAIVRFLTHTNQRIEHTIRAKRKIITLLNEQKQVIIHRAVTRGLDPNIRLKPSGIPWLGDIPEHWEVRRNGYIFKERNERGRVGLPVLIVSLRTGVTIGSETNEAGRERRLIADHTSYKLACQGDIAYNMMRMWQGAVGVVPAQGLVSPAYVVAQPLEGVNSSYYELLFRTDACKGEINRNSRGIVSDRNRLYWDDFKRLFLPVPPVKEQNCIVDNLSNQFAEVDLAISRTEREITLLREYRTRLIADVVTGKLDVREAAALLPDEVEEIEEVMLEDDEVTGEEVEA